MVHITDDHGELAKSPGHTSSALFIIASPPWPGRQAMRGSFPVLKVRNLMLAGGSKLNSTCTAEARTRQAKRGMPSYQLQSAWIQDCA